MNDLPGEQCFRYVADLLITARSTNQEEKVLSLVVDRLFRLYRSQTAAIVLIDPSTEYLCIDHHVGLSLTFCNAFRRSIATQAVGRLLWTGHAFLIRTSADDPALARELQLEHPFGSCAVVPISIDDRALGYLHLDSDTPDAFAERDLPIIQVFADIAALAISKSRLHEENLRLERVDKETGVEKYLPFIEKLHTAMVRANERGEDIAILLLDVDNFKQIVNTYGFDRSRQLLREMAGVITTELRPVDAVGRFGFDEFIVLLEDSDLEGALARARRILEAIAARTYTADAFTTTVSIGAAVHPQNGRTADELLTTAKRALFEAQRAGRNTIRHYVREWYSDRTPAGGSTAA